MKQIQDGYIYKGHTYIYEEDIEPEECIKRFHLAMKPGGKVEILAWSNSNDLTEEHFKMWIDLGCPVGPECYEYNGRQVKHGRWTPELLKSFLEKSNIDGVAV